MVTNGAAVRLPLDPPAMPAPVVSSQVTDKPVTEIEVKIGEAVAAAVIAIAMGINDYATAGSMTPATRVWCGGMLGRLAELNLDHFGEDDFGVIARKQGKRAVQRHPAGVFLTRLGQPGQVDAIIDELIGHALDISSKIVDSERALRRN